MPKLTIPVECLSEVTFSRRTTNDRSFVALKLLAIAKAMPPGKLHTGSGEVTSVTLDISNFDLAILETGQADLFDKQRTESEHK